MGINEKNKQLVVSVCSGVAINGHKPSVEFLFDSIVPSTYVITSVLLTGMGRDGSEALGRLKSAGAFTIAQDEESSVVYGMPGEAVRLGAAVKVLPLSIIAETLIQQTKE